MKVAKPIYRHPLLGSMHMALYQVEYQDLHLAPFISQPQNEGQVTVNCDP